MLKALMLRKKINEAKKSLEDLRAKKSELETRAADLEKREAETAEAIEEAQTEEEKAAVEEAVTAIEAEGESLENETAENDQAIEDLENEVADLERQLEETEENQTRGKSAPATPEANKPEGAIITERTNSTMYKTRSLNRMTLEQREAFVNREAVKSFLTNIRDSIKMKRSITGGNLLIPTEVLGLIRENVMEYSKLYSRINLVRTNGKGRQIIQGVAPEGIWEECCDAINELELTFGQVEVDCYKVAGYIAICNALIDDSDIDLLDAVTVALMQALGKAIDKAIVYGTGVKMPTGVVTAIANDDELATHLITIPSTATEKAFFEAIIDAASFANSDYSRGEKLWIVNEKTYAAIKKNSLAFDAAGALVAGVNGRMPVEGGDIIVLNFVPDNNIVMGYFDLYLLNERMGMEIDMSEHVRFIEDQTVTRARARMDGKPAIPAAFVAIGYGAAPTTEVTFPGQNNGGEG